MKKPAKSKWDIARESGATVEEALKVLVDDTAEVAPEKPAKELTERQKWNRECNKKRDADWEAAHPKTVKAKKVEGPRLPRTVAALTPEEQDAWVKKQIEQLNKRLGELSAIRLGTATA
jgi:hypothetical protein